LKQGKSLSFSLTKKKILDLTENPPKIDTISTKLTQTPAQPEPSQNKHHCTEDYF
jgi:hypothetical protein